MNGDEIDCLERKIRKLKWVGELNLTRSEKALTVAALCLVETDIAPRMDNVDRFSIEFVREVLSLDCVIRLFFSLDRTSLRSVASLTEKIHETSNI